LHSMGAFDGYFPPAGVDPTSDLLTWWSAIQSGEPYGSQLTQGLSMMTAYKSPYYVETGLTAAPTLLVSGFTDELFPVDEAVRWANRFSGGLIAQLYLDYGHPRAQNKAADLRWMRDRIDEWFAYYLKGDVTAPPLAGVEAFTQTCPFEAQSDGPFHAPSWDSLSPGEVRFLDGTTKTASSDPADPVGQTLLSQANANACTTTPSATQSGTATFLGPPAKGPGYTLLGSPTVIASLSVNPAVAPSDAQLDARLFDVDRSTDTQILVARGVYRPTANGRAVFQLHPNGWRFASNHAPKLELLGTDIASARRSNSSFAIDVSNVEVRLPVADQPGGQVKIPAAPVIP
jgi:hypothetical protein